MAAQIVDREDAREARHLAAEQAPHRLRLAHGDEKACDRALEDARLAAYVIGELREPDRRVDRHRDAAGSEHAVVRREEIAAGRQHDRHRLAGLEAFALEAGGDRRHVAREIGVGKARLLRFAVEDRDVQAIGLGAHVPVERLEQGRRVLRYLRDAAIGELHHVGGVRLALGPREEQPQQVARSLDFRELLLLDADAEHLLDPQP